MQHNTVVYLSTYALTHTYFICCRVVLVMLDPKDIKDPGFVHVWYLAWLENECRVLIIENLMTGPKETMSVNL